MHKPELDSFNTPALHERLDRWRDGDRQAADEILLITRARLEKLAARMCQSFPNVRNWTETGDVLQGSLMRLFRTLQKIKPASTRDFFNLAAVHIRRELLDLARHYRSKGWCSLHGHSTRQSTGHPDTEPATTLPDDFELWARFHEAVDELPAEEREVVGLAYYHGWTQVKIAELFQVDERTIRRRWASACRRLRKLVGGELPTE
jgi:RNA polymerase sigma-70 factor (ECF subfamily)